MLVLDLVTGSLRQIGIIGETDDPSAEQGADAVTHLNDMVASWEEDGIDLGWNPKASTASAAVIPKGYVATVKAALAVYLAGEYGVEVPQITALTAKDGYDRLLARAVSDQMYTTRLTNIPQGDAQCGASRILTDSEWRPSPSPSRPRA